MLTPELTLAPARSPVPAQVKGTKGFLPQPVKDIESPSSTRLEALVPSRDLRAMTRSASPRAWRPDLVTNHDTHVHTHIHTYMHAWKPATATESALEPGKRQREGQSGAEATGHSPDLLHQQTSGKEPGVGKLTLKSSWMKPRRSFLTLRAYDSNSNALH